MSEIIHVLDWNIGNTISCLWMNEEGHLCWKEPGEIPQKYNFGARIDADMIIRSNQRYDRAGIIWYV